MIFAHVQFIGLELWFSFFQYQENKLIAFAHFLSLIIATVLYLWVESILETAPSWFQFYIQRAGTANGMV